MFHWKDTRRWQPIKITWVKGNWDKELRYKENWYTNKCHKGWKGH